MAPSAIAAARKPIDKRKFADMAGSPFDAGFYQRFPAPTLPAILGSLSAGDPWPVAMLYYSISENPD
jgi:hypothetical protein